MSFLQRVSELSLRDSVDLGPTGCAKTTASTVLHRKAPAEVVWISEQDASSLPPKRGVSVFD